jgi:exportin-2 (importin alpha re-exporter)
VSQILALLLELRPATDGLSAAYQSLFTPLLTPALWESRGNVPALTRLVSAYLRQGGAGLVAGPALSGVLGVFQKLLSSKANDALGVGLLETLTASLPP